MAEANGGPNLAIITQRIDVNRIHLVIARRIGLRDQIMGMNQSMIVPGRCCRRPMQITLRGSGGRPKT